MRKKLIPPVWRPRIKIIAIGLFVLIAAVMQLWLRSPSAPLTVRFYDIGQGDGIHIRTQDGFDVLIDGGPTDRIIEKLGRSMPFGDNTIDLMILTHPHSDHLIGQLGVLDRFKVKRVVGTGVLHTTDEYISWLNKIKQKNISFDIAKPGMKYEFGSAKLEILWPKEDFSGKRITDAGIDNDKGGGLNDTSIVARLEFGGVSFLLVGDISREVEKTLIDCCILESNVLKVAHHGSKHSSSQEFIEAVDPDYAVIQSGIDNKFGHPAFVTLWHLQQQGIKILRNDQEGDVVFTSDGTELKVD